MDFRLPELGEGVYEAELVAWLVKVGEFVRHGQNLMEVLTDKATMEVPSPFSGSITELRAQPGQQVKVGDAILAYTPAEHPAVVDSPTAPEAADAAAAMRKFDVAATASPSKMVNDVAKPPHRNGPSRSAVSIAGPVRAAPSVRYLARKLNIDLSRIQGSGPQGRILLDDLTDQIKTVGGEGKQPSVAKPRPDYGKPGTRIKLQGVRRKIAEHMVHAKRTIPHYSYVDECDVTELVRLRDSLREPYSSAGIKLTYLAFIVKAVVTALKEIPLVNSSLDEQSGEIILHDRYHIGVAVAAPAGLMVPVVHDADRKNLGQIAREIERLSDEVRTGKGRLEDLRGGTFTVTSIGNIGGLFSTPVINHPEVGILGVGKIVKRPVFDAGGNVRPADLMYLSFSFDHRVVDGAIGAAFGNIVQRQLQHPARLLLPDNLG